mgnify:CR=1 FL=1
MSTYPDLPDNRLIVNGVDLSVTYQMVLLDGYTLEPPEPKTYTVDIPGGNGVIDLTEALTNDVVYKNRKQEFEFALINVENFEWVKTELSNFLHGRKFDYTMTMDPGYTYHGRFSVSSYTHSAYSSGILGNIKISIDADPYKTKENVVYRLNATGGRLFRLESGRRPVHPILECEQPCFITWNGTESIIPAGTYRLNDVLFNDGWNEIYINSSKLWYVRWDEVGQNGAHAMTWDQASTYRWDDLQRLGNEEAKTAPHSWEKVGELLYRWVDLADKHWSELDYRRSEVPETTVYFKYDWEDL